MSSFPSPSSSHHDDSPWRRFPSMLSRLVDRRGRGRRDSDCLFPSPASSSMDLDDEMEAAFVVFREPRGDGLTLGGVNRSVSCFAMLQPSRSLGRLSSPPLTLNLSPVAQLRVCSLEGLSIVELSSW